MAVRQEEAAGMCDQKKARQERSGAESQLQGRVGGDFLKTAFPANFG